MLYLNVEKTTFKVILTLVPYSSLEGNIQVIAFIFFFKCTYLLALPHSITFTLDSYSRLNASNVYVLGLFFLSG